MNPEQDFGELYRLRREYHRGAKVRTTATVAEMRRLLAQPLKANGHAETCVCRICFEEWRAARP